MRSIALIFLFIACAITAFASNPEESSIRYYRHEVNVSIGISDVEKEWSKDYESDIKKRFGRYDIDGTNVVLYKWKEKQVINSYKALYSISYYYHFNHSIAVGCFFGYGNTHDRIGSPRLYKLGGSKKTITEGDTYVKNTYMYIMPSVKCAYMNSRWCSLYAKVAAGFYNQELRLESDFIPAVWADKYRKHESGFAYYVAPIGWELGHSKIRWFFEFGMGTNTNIQAGMTYRFGRY